MILLTGVAGFIGILWGMLGGWLGAWRGLRLSGRRAWPTAGAGGLVLLGVAARLCSWGASWSSASSANGAAAA